MATKCYSELIKLNTFEERYEYLKLDGRVAEQTFGYDRYLNQAFYQSEEWKNFRNYIIVRDNGCDLAIPDRILYGDKLLIHHIVPIKVDDIKKSNIKVLLDPDNVILTCYKTHQAIHYGHLEMVSKKLIEREPNDTCPWKR